MYHPSHISNATAKVSRILADELGVTLSVIYSISKAETGPIEILTVSGNAGAEAIPVDLGAAAKAGESLSQVMLDAFRASELYMHLRTCAHRKSSIDVSARAVASIEILIG